jgi:hypothetical protein
LLAVGAGGSWLARPAPALPASAAAAGSRAI